jgi:hypothetical protein
VANYKKHLLSQKHILKHNNSHLNKSGTNDTFAHHKINESQPKVNQKSTFSQPLVNLDTSALFSCKYCHHKFKFKQSMYKHIKYSCTKNKTEDLTELVRLLNLQLESKDKQLEKQDKQIETQSKQIEKLMGKLEINGSFNTTINNVNINLLNYDDTDISHLTHKDYEKCIKQVYTCVMKMIEKIHFNPDKPENMNLYISNIKSKHIMMYKDNKWILTNNSELDSIYADKDNLIKTWIEENNIKDPELLEKFNKYLNMDESKLKEVYDDINLLMFNNKHLIKN